MAYDLGKEDEYLNARPTPGPFDYQRKFRPVVVRARHDGWSPEKQGEFITALGECGCVADACRRVGMSTESAYRLRARPDAIDFRLSWQAALDYAIDRLEDSALSRAIHGVVEPRFYKGEQIGEVRRFDGRLTQFLLRYRKPVTYARCWDRMTVQGGHPEEQVEAFAAGIDRTMDDVSRDELERENIDRATAYAERAARDAEAAAAVDPDSLATEIAFMEANLMAEKAAALTAAFRETLRPRMAAYARTLCGDDVVRPSSTSAGDGEAETPDTAADADPGWWDAFDARLAAAEEERTRPAGGPDPDDRCDYRNYMPGGAFFVAPGAKTPIEYKSMTGAPALNRRMRRMAARGAARAALAATRRAARAGRQQTPAAGRP